MGTTNNIKEIIQDWQLIKRTCGTCNFYFTQKDHEEKNYDIIFRTNNGTDWKDFDEQEHRGWIGIEVELYHETCPDRDEDESEDTETDTDNKDIENE